MTQQKPAGGGPAKTLGTTSHKDNRSEAQKPNKKTRLEVKPEFWDTFLDNLPPWLDEVTAIGLLVFGVVSFMALFDLSSDATLANAWSNALTLVFGYGSILVSIGIFALGIILLLPKLGIIIRLGTARIVALEIAFFSVLAILHLTTGDTELRALARAGEGGGYIGWGLCAPFYWALGRTLTTIFYGTIFVLSVSWVMGLRKSQIGQLLQQASERLQSLGQRMTVSSRVSGTPTAPPVASSSPQVPPVSTNLDSALHLPRTGVGAVMRIRPNPENVPPSQRIAPQPKPAAAPSSFTPADAVDARLERIITGQRSVESPDTLLPEFNAIGKILPAKGKGPTMVERPDGRIKRYFTVENLKEIKKVGKREKSLPPLELLQDVDITPPDNDEVNRNAVLIENTLLEFDINIDVVDVKVGPTVTQYAVQPFREARTDEGETVLQRTRLSKIAALANDLSLALSARRLRLETPVPGHSYMGVEVPNKKPSIVALRSVYESRDYFEKLQKAKSPLVIPLGRDVAGAPVIVDLASMPHLLIAGTTGSGKSVCIAALTTALILNNGPDVVKLVLLDPKMVELSRFNGLPHLLGPVETDLERIIGVLRWCTREMDRRYKLLEENAARNIEVYNSRLGQRRKDEQLPYIVLMIDEIGDLMMNRPEETEKTITRLAQMARAVGIHLVVATQRPSVDVITGLIKANFPARISFALPSGIDSRVILDTVGAETLLGKGDMLYLAPDAAGPKRLQGCYVTDDEVRSVVQHWKDWYETQRKEGRIERLGVAPWERGLTRREFLSETDPMLEDAIDLVIEEQEASASLIQRKLGLGYPRAARIMDLLEELGIVGEPLAGGRSRRVLIEKGKDPFKEIMDKRAKGP